MEQSAMEVWHTAERAAQDAVKAIRRRSARGDAYSPQDADEIKRAALLRRRAHELLREAIADLRQRRALERWLRDLGPDAHDEP